MTMPLLKLTSATPKAPPRSGLSNSGSNSEEVSPRQSTRQEAHHAHSVRFQVKPVDQRPGHQHGQKRRRRTRPPVLAGQNHRKSCQPEGQGRQMGVR